MEITTDAGRRAWAAILADPRRTLLCTDFDGVVAPIVTDPDAAWASEAVVGALALIGPHVAKVAVVTGRPARKAVELGRFEQRHGLEKLSVLGLYGFERWDAESGSFVEPTPPEGVRKAAGELPGLLASLGLEAARVEDKRLSIGVHTRELPDPAGALDLLERPLRELAAAYGLLVEPGRFVLELRAAGVDKGDAIRGLVAEVDPQVVVFAGDDLGDVPAFEAVREFRDTGGGAGLLICSASVEQTALVELADVVVDGPGGVADLLSLLADELTRRA